MPHINHPSTWLLCHTVSQDDAATHLRVQIMETLQVLPMVLIPLFGGTKQWGVMRDA